MFLSTNWPISYLSIQHLTSFAEKVTNNSAALNPPAKKLLTWEDQKKLNFSEVRTFVCHVELALREVYDLVIRLWKHFMLVDKQNLKLKLKFTNYEKANKAYVIDNAQLKAKNNNLENWLANLEKHLKNARLDKHSALSPLPLPSVISDNSDDNLK